MSVSLGACTTTDPKASTKPTGSSGVLASSAKPFNTVDSEAAAESLVGGDSPDGTNASETSTETDAPTVDAALVRGFTDIGVEDIDAATACMQKQDPSLTIESLNTNPTRATVKAMIVCLPSEMSASLAQQISAEGIAEPIKQCLALARVQIAADQDTDENLRLLLSAESVTTWPDPAKQTITQRAKDCGVAEADLDRVLAVL
jgi:hypothetical protein